MCSFKHIYDNFRPEEKNENIKYILHLLIYLQKNISLGGNIKYFE